MVYNYQDVVFRFERPVVVLGVFIREKKNRSGSVSIQLLEKRGRRNFLIKSFGASSDPVQINRLKRQAQEYARKIKGQLVLNFDAEEE